MCITVCFCAVALIMLNIARGGLMKEYFNRLVTIPKKHTLIIWWVFRALLLFAFVYGLVGFIKGSISPFTNRPFDITDPLQVGANILCTFVWEIFMLLPEKNSLRYIDPKIQSVLIVGIFLGSFCGKFLNMYYASNVLDVAMHFVGGGICVIFGYEIITAMQLKDKAKVPISIVLLCSLGFSFLASVGWELFEFIFDQISCVSAAAQGLPVVQATGDAQHWNYALSLLDGSVKQPLISPIYAERWPLMDTMSDTVLNTCGALIGIIILKLYPYHHKGKNNIEAQFDKEMQKGTA